MNRTTATTDTVSIELSEHLPRKPETVWKVLTDGALIARWLGMTPQGFQPVVGNEFTYRTTPAGEWDGTIRCKVLEAVPNERLVYSWKGGDQGNTGYGAPLDTVVTITLRPVDGGTQMKLVHSGFHLPRNATAYRSMSDGWTECAGNIGAMIREN